MKPRQRQALAVISHHIREFGCAPSCTAIAQALDLSSASHAARIVNSLVEAGFVVRHAGHRAIQVTPQGQAVLDQQEASPCPQEATTLSTVLAVDCPTSVACEAHAASQGWARWTCEACPMAPQAARDMALQGAPGDGSSPRGVPERVACDSQHSARRKVNDRVNDDGR